MTIKSDIPRKWYIGLSISTFVIFFFLWCFLTYGGYVKPYFLSSPTSVYKAMISLFTDHDFIDDIMISIFRILTGFLVSALIAVPLGILTGCFKVCEALITSFVNFVRYLPVPALVPFCILWFGVGEVEKVMIVFIGVFFQLVLMVADIVKNIPREFLETAYTLGASTRKVILKVVVPHSMPAIVDSLRITMGWAWGWLILAELVGANQGIGFMIIKSQRYLNNANMIVGLIILGLLGIIFNFLFLTLYKFAFRWKKHE